MTKPIHCPKCKSEKVVEILYGYPTSKAVKAEQRGDIFLGGCEVSSKNPTHFCRVCNKKFKIRRDEKMSKIEEKVKNPDEVIANAEAKLAEAKEKLKDKKETKKKVEPKYNYKQYSGRISYPSIWAKPLAQIAKEKKMTIKQLYQLSVKNFLMKEGKLPPNNS